MSCSVSIVYMCVKEKFKACKCYCNFLLILSFRDVQEECMV